MDVDQVSPLAEVRARLTPGHDQIARLIEDILAVPRSEAERLRALWLPFAAVLAAHLDEEDRHMIPPLLQVAEQEARGLVLEHRHVRARIAQLDMAFNVGTLSSSAVRSFAEEVLAHQRREHTLIAKYVTEPDD